MLRNGILTWTLVLVAAGIVAFLVIGTRGDDEGPSMVQAPPASPTSSADEAPEAEQFTFAIKMIPTIQFDKDELTIPANQDATIKADNTDDGILHNFAVYDSREEAEGGEDAIAATQECSAPCTGSATLNVPPGEYFFRCDFHPQQMTGTLVVQ